MVLTEQSPVVWSAHWKMFTTQRTESSRVDYKTHLVKVIAAKPDAPSLIPRIHMVEEEI